MSIHHEIAKKLFDYKKSIPEGIEREDFEAKVREALKSSNPEQATLDLLQATNPTESPNESRDKDPKLSVPYPLRNVLGFTVEQANQKNLIDQNIMQSTVYNNTEPIQPTDILRSVNFALGYNQWQLLNSAGAVQKYGQSIETQE